jgi:glycosyltransferase involved in cell wall biosynthesis
MAKQFIVGFSDESETVRITTRKPSVSVVYRMFDEAENLARAVHFAEAVLTNMTSDYHILIVNDASTHRSTEIAEALGG